MSTNADSSPTEATPEAALSLFDGTELAEDAPSPPPKAKRAAPEAELAQEPTESPETREDLDSGITFKFLEEGVLAQKEALEARTKELEARVAELEPEAKKAAMKIQDLLDDLEFEGKLTREEMQTLAEALVYQLNPDVANDDLKSKVSKSRAERERIRSARQLEEIRAKAEETVAKQRTESIVSEYRAEVKYLTKNLTEFPSVETWYGEDRARLQEDIVRAASYLAANGASSDDDVAPERILSLMEKELAAKYTKAPQKRPKTTHKSVPVSSDVERDDVIREAARYLIED
jgi:polyhydroxyalkanoate synthesis regulator phasin